MANAQNKPPRKGCETTRGGHSVGFIFWCTPGMGVNLWGESPLYVSPVNVLNILTKILAEGKGGTVRDRPEEARVQSYEPTNRNGI